MANDDVFKYLRRSDLFKNCSDQEILEIKPHVERIEIAAGGVVFTKGDLAEALYVIERGAIEIRIGEGKPRDVIARLEENAVLGEVGILTDQVRSAWAIGVVPSVLLKISRSTLERMLSENRLVAYKLMVQLAKILSVRLRQMDAAIVKLMHKENRPHEHEINQLRAKLQADWPF